jgi:hypothetical protein
MFSFLLDLCGDVQTCPHKTVFLEKIKVLIDRSLAVQPGCHLQPTPKVLIEIKCNTELEQLRVV